MLHTLIVVHW